MKFFVMMILMALVTAIQPAGAQWRHNGGGRHFEVQQGQRQGGYQGGYQQRQPPQRDYRQPDYRRDYRQPDRRPDGRMTDEERSNLRRDLDRANREIYKGR